jgi:hypothetical protein
VRNINARRAENVMILNLEAAKELLVLRRIFWPNRAKITRG